jgi:hypothetical protein
MPFAAKCSQGGAMQEEARYVYLGVFHHSRYNGDETEVQAEVGIRLMEDPDYPRHEEVPTSFLADLYNPFTDVRDLLVLDQQLYPQNHQFIFWLNVSAWARAERVVEVYKDRATLVHMRNDARLSRIVVRLEFESPVINNTPVLSSSRAAPKTLFDFDKVHFGRDKHIIIETDGQPSIWLAIFGARHGYVQVLAGPPLASPEPGSPATGHGASIGFLILFCTVTVGFCFHKRSVGTTDQPPGLLPALDPTTTCVEACVVDATCGEGGGCLGGEHAAEDRFLRRAGVGDDGI